MGLDIEHFKIEYNHITPGKGKVLVAEPFLQDNYFKRSIVLITECNESGTIGFVLNKPVQIPIQDILIDFPEINSPISIGGPVNTNTIHYIHTLGELIPNSLEVKKGIYWGGDYEVIRDMVLNGMVNNSQLKFFLGYSGWSPGQLESELNQNSWMVTDVSAAWIMQNNAEKYWEDTLSKLGDRYKVWLNAPQSPSMN